MAPRINGKGKQKNNLALIQNDHKQQERQANFDDGKTNEEGKENKSK